MIISRAHGAITLVRQVDHQQQCGRMADAWGNADFARFADWADIAEAARVHDEGWREEDEAPRMRVDGTPMNFHQIERARHASIYTLGIERAAVAGARPAILVSMHGTGLHRQRLGLDPPAHSPDLAPEVEQFLAREDRRVEALRSTLEDDLSLSAWLWDAYRLIQTWDALSLYLTWRGIPDGTVGLLPKVPRTPNDEGVSLVLEPLGQRTVACHPFPFAGSEIALPVAARIIEDRRFADDDDLRQAMLQAVPTDLEFVVCRHPAAR